jgi:hypothetical protein
LVCLFSRVPSLFSDQKESILKKDYVRINNNKGFVHQFGLPPNGNYARAIAARIKREASTRMGLGKRRISCQTTMVIALISAWGFANEPASQTNQAAGVLLHQSLKRFSLTAAFYGKTRNKGQIFFVGTVGLFFA